MNAFDQKDECRQKSIVKPAWTQEGTCDTSMKSPLSSSSVKAPPISMAPILSSRGRKKELHGLATLAQNFRHVVTVSSSILQCYTFCLHSTHVPPKSNRILAAKILICERLSTCWASQSGVSTMLSTFWTELVLWKRRMRGTVIGGSP